MTRKNACIKIDTLYAAERLFGSYRFDF